MNLNHHLYSILAYSFTKHSRKQFHFLQHVSLSLLQLRSVVPMVNLNVRSYFIRIVNCLSRQLLQIGNISHFRRSFRRIYPTEQLCWKRNWRKAWWSHFICSGLFDRCWESSTLDLMQMMSGNGINTLNALAKFNTLHPERNGDLLDLIVKFHFANKAKKENKHTLQRNDSFLKTRKINSKNHWKLDNFSKSLSLLIVSKISKPFST